MRRQLEDHLQASGYQLDDRARIVVLMDSPPGSALTRLERDSTPQTLVVMTNNPCCAYWQAILEFSPRGFLVGDTPTRDVDLALRIIARNGRMHRHPPMRLKLPKREQRVLRQVAGGLENKRIARALNLSDRVVSRYLDGIFTKVRAAYPELHLENRTQLALWFWGLWDVQRAVEIESAQTDRE
jgi:DNA-binding NarL/FixJ family response regulator